MGGSPSWNASAPLPPDSSHNSSQSCFTSTPGIYIFAAFTATNTLFLLPLSVFVLLLGWRRWRGGGAAANPADVFAFHMAAMEAMGVCGAVVCCCGAVAGHPVMVAAGSTVFAIISCVKMMFHVLTCTERYVAVVHPVTYRRLNRRGGVAIRHVSTTCVWLVCGALMAVQSETQDSFGMTLFFCSVVFSLAVVTFCSLSVLRVLLRPGPGEGGGAKAKVDRSKRRAFSTIAIILAVLLLRLLGNLVCFTLGSKAAVAALLSGGRRCAVQMSGVWFCLPTGYVLPLLFLHRAGKPTCFQARIGLECCSEHQRGVCRRP